MTYYIYIIYSISIDRYYVGYSSNPWLRLGQHLNNTKDKYTGKATDWILLAVFEVSGSESDAIRMEQQRERKKSSEMVTFCFVVGVENFPPLLFNLLMLFRCAHSHDQILMDQERKVSRAIPHGDPAA